MSSETGTCINGIKRESAELVTGDVISIGSLDVLFIDPGKKPGPVQRVSGLIDPNITIQGDLRLSSLDINPKEWFLEAVKGPFENLYALKEPEYIVGSSQECDIVLKGWGIAKKHAAFIRDDISVKILPLSEKKTMINDDLLNNRTVLQSADVIRIGKYILTLLQR